MEPVDQELIFYSSSFYLTLNYKVLFMKTEQEYIRDLSEIRQMMERSSKFVSLTGWSGIMAGIYALAGAFIAYHLFYNTEGVVYNSISIQQISGGVFELIILAVIILLLAIGTAIFLSFRKAKRNKEVLWNATARRLVVNMAIPLITGGVFILILMAKGILGLLAPLTLIFYGLALINASKFTFDEVRYLGIFQILLGLLSSYFIGFGLLFWAIGFGILHIIYGIYMHWRYEK